MRAPVSRILVIKLGAVGDYVQASAAFQDIRNHYPHAHITLLTTRNLLPLASGAPFFNAVITDARLPFWHIGYLMDLRKRLRGFDLVIDLQNNQRTRAYFYMLGRPRWSGMVKGCAHELADTPKNRNMHVLDRQAKQLALLGVASQHLPDVRFARHDTTDKLATAGLTEGKYVVLVAGSSDKHAARRWPHFEELARRIVNGGHQCVLVGTRTEADLLHQIAALTGAVNLGGQTTLNQLVDICANAKAFVGNDTGPSHIAAACGIAGVVLFGNTSKPESCAPRGRNVHVLQKENIADITVDDVIAQLPQFLGDRT